MSIMRCDGCGKFVALDFDSESIYNKDDDAWLCRICQEKENTIDLEVSYYLKANEMASSNDPEVAAIGRLTKEIGMIMPDWAANEVSRGTPIEEVFNAAIRFHATSLASTVLAITKPDRKNIVLDYTAHCLVGLFNGYKKDCHEESEKMEEER